MAKGDKSAKTGKDKGKAAAVKEAAEIVKSETTTPLKVEVNFPNIFDLKQAVGFDSDSNLVMGIQFKVKVDQFETFRLLNLLKQPHAPLSATIFSSQSAMDFKFTKDGKVEILKAQVATDKKKLPAAEPKKNGDNPVRIAFVAFNHLPEEKLPFGLALDVVNGTGRQKSYAGRGKNPTEAVVAAAVQAGIVGPDVKEPFEVKKALQSLEKGPEVLKLIRVIDVGSFEGEENKGGSQDKGK